MAKKILIVSRSFYPQNSPRSFRTTELAKELARQGHQVTVLTPFHPDHKEFSAEYNLELKDLGEVKWKNFELKGNKIAILFKRVFNRISGLLFEFPNIELIGLVRKALKKESGYDLLISIAVPYPVHWGVASVWNNKKREKNPAKVWIADCGDPFFGRENDSFKLPFYWAWVEKWFMKKVDFVTVPFEGAKNAYFKEFYPKFRVIPQGLSYPTKVESKSIFNDRPIFAYFGNVGSYLYTYIPFFEFLNSIDLNFKFIIYTKEKEVYLKNLSPETLKKCEINQYASREELFNNLNHVDFLLHFPYKYGCQLSLKLADYSFLNKPVISYRNEEGDKENFSNFLNGDYSGKADIDDYKKFEISTVAKSFLNLI